MICNVKEAAERIIANQGLSKRGEIVFAGCMGGVYHWAAP